MKLRESAVRDVVYFVSLYLSLSLPPFLWLNRNLLAEISHVAIVAVLGTVALVGIAGLLLAREGVEKYTRFLLHPLDIPSIFVDSSFVLAAVSWWLMPELAIYFEWELQLSLLLVAIIICHVPMVLFMSLMTSIGKAQHQ